jgi:hypothetical protein
MDSAFVYCRSASLAAPGGVEPSRWSEVGFLEKPEARR